MTPEEILDKHSTYIALITDAWYLASITDACQAAAKELHEGEHYPFLKEDEIRAILFSVSGLPFNSTSGAALTLLDMWNQQRRRDD